MRRSDEHNETFLSNDVQALGLFAFVAIVVWAFSCGSASMSADAGSGSDAAFGSDAASAVDAGGKDSGGGADAGCMCNAQTTGLCAPLSTCSVAAPCDDAAADASVSASETIPNCATKQNDQPPRPQYTDPRFTWINPLSGEARTACVYSPDGGQQLPLVVFFHGSLASADMVYDDTSLRTKAMSFPLGTTTGFVLASVQGRNIHWPDTHNEGTHHDFFFRDPSTTSANPDFQAADHWIDTLVSGGGVDPSRIFITGWSNGAFFAQEYAIARFSKRTPGGNLVAAAAVYAGGDPFNNTTGSQSPTCQLATYPQTQVPLLIVHRDCDAQVACNEGQRQSFGLPPGFFVEDWLTASLWGSMGDTVATGAVTVKTNQTWVSGGDLLLDASGAPVAACQQPASCTKSAGNTNHHAWPDGVADGSNVDWEPTMLTFLQKHHR
jgi:poly(3-hydroxybutyrate) depolymerase